MYLKASMLQIHRWKKQQTRKVWSLAFLTDIPYFPVSISKCKKIFLLLFLMYAFGILSFSGSWWTVLWKHIILQNGGAITNLLNISCLAKVSDGFTQGHIVQAVQAVLSELRLLQMTRKPLRTAEFMTSLARQDPVYKEEEETFKVTLRAMLTGCLSLSLAMSLSRHIWSRDLLILLMGWHITIWVMMYGSTAPNTHLPHFGMFGSLGCWTCQANGHYYRQQPCMGNTPGILLRWTYCLHPAHLKQGGLDMHR